MKPTAEVVQTSPAVEVVEVPTPVIFEPVETPKPWTHEEVAALAKMLWGEARGVPSETEQAACVYFCAHLIRNPGKCRLWRLFSKTPI